MGLLLFIADSIKTSDLLHDRVVNGHNIWSADKSRGVLRQRHESESWQRARRPTFLSAVSLLRMFMSASRTGSSSCRE